MPANFWWAFFFRTHDEETFVPSRFGEDEILKSMKAIREVACERGQSYIVNMSFGSQVGPHDGTTPYDQAMNTYSERGCLLVAAMGNEGDECLHATHVFTTDERKYVVVNPAGAGQRVNAVDLWGTNTNGLHNLSVRPCIYDKKSEHISYKDSMFWATCGTINASIEPYNGKEHYYFQLDANTLREGDSDKCLALEIKGKAGEGFHVWVSSGFGSVATYLSDESFVLGDNRYCVGEGAASIPQAIAVGSYNSNNGNFISAVTGGQYAYGGPEGQISDFSNNGLWLGTQ